MPRFELRTLGGLSLRGPNGRERTDLLAHTKRAAVLVYLAVDVPYGFRRRDKLLGIFWPELDEEHARTSLRKALHYLRSALGDVVGGRGEEEIALTPESLWCDTTVFDERLRAGHLEDALSLYQGDFLDGFYVSGCPEFERWVDAQRLRLNQQVTDAAAALATRAEAAGNVVGAMRWYQRVVDLRPDHESAARKLIELLDRAGDRSGAIATYEAFARRVREDLDAEPAPETQALVALVRGRVAAVEQPVAQAPVRDALPSDEAPPPPERPRLTLRRTLTGTIALALLLFGAWSIYATRRGGVQDAAPSATANDSARSATTEEYYVRGRELMNNARTAVDLQTAMGHFRRAIELDSTFAPAVAGLAVAFARGPASFGFPRTWHDSGMALARKAVALDSTAATGYRALSILYTTRHRKRKAIEADVRAVSLDSSYFYAVGTIAANYAQIGQFDNALDWLNRMRRIVPRPRDFQSTWSLTYVGLHDLPRAEAWAAHSLQTDSTPAAAATFGAVLLSRGEYDRAREQLRRALQRAPTDHVLLSVAGDVELFSGNLADARALYEQALQQTSTRNLAVMNTFYGRRTSTSLAYVLWQSGERESARALLHRSDSLSRAMLADSSDWWAYPYDLAAVSAIRGDYSQTYVWLERAVAAGWRLYDLGRSDPFLEALRQDERFKEIIARVNGMVHEIRRRATGMEWPGPPG